MVGIGGEQALELGGTGPLQSYNDPGRAKFLFQDLRESFEVLCCT